MPYSNHMNDITRWLEKVNPSDAHAADELLSLVYGELRKMAAGKMNGERAGHTLQPTLLADEVFLRLFPPSMTFSKGEINEKELASFALKLISKSDPVSAFVNEQMDPATRAALVQAVKSDLKKLLVQILNGIVTGPSIYDKARFAAFTLDKEMQSLVASQTTPVTNTARLNRLLLETAYPLELSRKTFQKFNSRKEFFGAAAVVMRRILVDHARRRNAVCHGGLLNTSTLMRSMSELSSPASPELVLLVNEALERFAVNDLQTVHFVERRFFLGMTSEEAAEACGITLRTAERMWQYFKTWFHREYGNQLGK